MDIFFGFVPGINHIDTPYFSNVTEQIEYFENLFVSKLTTSYYPPHYKNVIKVGVDDVDFTNNVNYAWFTFKGKTYYYFIDNVEYVNEYLINIYITMDYIQTYMFNIRVNNGIIERKFIDRWKYQFNRYVINREYLRENVSGGLFEKGLKNYVWSNNEALVFILKFTKYEAGSINQKCETYLQTDNGILVSPYMYKIFVPQQFYSYSIVENSPDIHFEPNSSDVLVNYLTDPNIIDAYAVPIKYLSSIMEIIDGVLVLKKFTITGISQQFEPRIAYYNDQDSTNGYKTIYYWDTTYTFASIKRLGFPKFYTNETCEYFEYTRNASKDVIFSSNYITQMFDENYQYVIYGNAASNFAVPVHYLILPNLSFTTLFFPTQGTFESYCLMPLVYGINNFDTSCIDTNILTVDLFNEAWKEYVANNKNRWVTSFLSAGLSGLEAFVDIATTSAFASKSLNRLWKDSRSYTKKKLQPKVGALRYADRIKDDESKSIISTLSDLPGGIIKPLVAQGVEDANKQQAPMSVKQLGEYVSIASFVDKLYFMQIYEVRDFEQCAQYFHRNGFHVEEHISAIHNIFDYVKNRYYFNILKMSSVNITCTGCITDNETIEGIIDRLMDGVRLWNTANDVIMGDFTYDNVELSYLS